MRNILERLQEKRNIEVAKEILESNGYEVLKEEESQSEYIPAGWGYRKSIDPHYYKLYKNVLLRIEPPENRYNHSGKYIFNPTDMSIPGIAFDNELHELLRDENSKFDSFEEAEQYAYDFVDRISKDHEVSSVLAKFWYLYQEGGDKFLEICRKEFGYPGKGHPTEEEAARVLKIYHEMYEVPEDQVNDFHFYLVRKLGFKEVHDRICDYYTNANSAVFVVEKEEAEYVSDFINDQYD